MRCVNREAELRPTALLSTTELGLRVLGCSVGLVPLIQGTFGEDRAI